MKEMYNVPPLKLTITHPSGELMPKQIIFFDFDQTLTIEHTFRSSCLDRFPTKSSKELIQYGSEHAEKPNLKEGLSVDKFALNDNHLFCIATYHNNPDFIAGYLQVLLGKTITPSEEAIKYTPDTNIAIKKYLVDGCEFPLLISYIPKLGAEFNASRLRLNGKNEQILFLMDTLMSEKLIPAETMVLYYDDDVKNIEASKSLPFVTAYHVDGTAPSFQLVGEACAKAMDSVPLLLPITLGRSTMFGGAIGVSSGSSASTDDSASEKRPGYV